MADLDGVIIGAPAGMEDLSNVWSDRPAWMTEITDIAEIFPVIASDGPARTYGGLGVNVDNTLVVDPAAENYWETVIQAVLPSGGVQGVCGGVASDNWWNLQRFITEASTLSAEHLMDRINWTSLDQHMIGVSVPGMFWGRTDVLPVPQDRRFLTAYKLGHSDLVQLIEDRYALTILAGIPPSAPRFATQCRLGTGVQLVEWDIPDTSGSGPITEYRIYRGTDPAAMAQLDVVDGSTLHYLDPAAPDGAIYYVTCYNNVIESVAGWATSVEEPDLTCRSLRGCICGSAVCGLGYAGWVGVAGVRIVPDGQVNVPHTGSVQLGAVTYPADATVPAVAWSSSSALITVDGTGLVTGTGKAAAAIITARAIDGGCEYDVARAVTTYNTMVDDMAALLLAAGFSNIYTRFSPDVCPAIMLLQTSGLPSSNAVPIDTAGLLVMVRDSSLASGRATVKAVHDALHSAAPVEISSTHYYTIEALSTGTYSEKTPKGPRYVFTLNLLVERAGMLEGGL